MLKFDFDRESRPVAPHRLFSISDGDTPSILQPVRMVSTDTPEKTHYAGRAEDAQPKLDLCRQRLLDGFYAQIPDKLRDARPQSAVRTAHLRTDARKPRSWSRGRRSRGRWSTRDPGRRVAPLRDSATSSD